MTIAKQGSLVDHEPGESSEDKAQALALRESGLSKAVPDAGMLPMIERLAAIPDFDVAKLEKLIDMQERILDRNAKTEFNAAFAEMQAKLPTIIEKKTTDKGKYAPREDIVDAVRPILQEFGFSLNFRTEWPEKKLVKVIGILTHRAGHSQESEFLSEADNSGSKNAIQALGSAVEYGRRYTTTDLLNIATRGGDDDGERFSKQEMPEGFEAFGLELEALVPKGIEAVTKRFNEAPVELKNYLVKQKKSSWDNIKTRAQEATKEQRGRR